MSNVPLAQARTMLFVPGDRPDRFEKAAASGADGIVLDLEDAVAPDSKAAARGEVVTWLDRTGVGVVRINPPGTEWFEADVEAIRRAPRRVMLPKASPAAAAHVMGLLSPGSRLVALIETSAGVLDARLIAETRGVARLAFGNVDLGAELGVDPDDHRALLVARSALVLASAAGNLPAPLDGVTTSVNDSEALIRDVRLSKAVGFAGKLCIHPRQVAWANHAMAPAPEQLLYAQRVIAAAGDGRATVLDGKMLDKPVIARARRLVGLAEASEANQ